MTDYLGSLVGQGSGVKVGNPGRIPAVATHTPAYRLYTNFGDYAGSGAYTQFTKLGTAPQLEMERRFPEFMSEVDKLRGMAAPTASLFRTAAMGQINAAESQALGNVREQLARRGLSGASFGMDTQARVEGEFAQKRAETELAAANQEINLTSRLVDFQNTLINQQINREVQELGIASGVTTNLVNIANQNLAVQAQLAMAQAQIDFVDWQQRVNSGGQLVGALTGAGLGMAAGGGGTAPAMGAGGSFGSLFGGPGTVGSWVNIFGPSQRYSGDAYTQMMLGFGGGSPLG